MNTPICDFVSAYALKEAVRFHMPGHKGKAILGPEMLDITEIDGADVLYSAGGIIRESQQNAAALFGAARTLYSAEGSSLCIRAMVYLARLHAVQQGKKPLILAARNAHKVFITAAALLDVDVEWLFPPDGGLMACPVSPENLEKRLAQEQPSAVYLTSPDYLGNLQDISAIARLCRQYGALLLVDNAHGAYLKFLEKSLHPLDLGAHICCDSAHKTLGVLTGGAYLHVSQSAPALLHQQAENALSLFASTSPSYLILQSLDKANQALDGEYPSVLSALIKKVAWAKEALAHEGYALAGEEPMKITLLPKGRGYRGNELARILESQGMVCEFCDRDHLVLMPSIHTCTQELDRLVSCLSSLEKLAPVEEIPPRLTRPRAAMKPHQAVMAPREQLPVEKAVGRILASPSVNCPPAVPILTMGEVVSREAADLFSYYGIDHCWVTLS